MADASEAARLEALYSLALLDTEPEPAFDSVTDLAASLARSRMAAVSLIDRDRQWFKSNINMPASETPRDIAFCDHVVRGGVPLYVPDARADERFRENPLVTGEPHIRGYAGIPLHEPGGHRIGTLCVIHDAPFDLDDATLSRLQSLADVLEERIAARSQLADAQRTNALLEESERRFELAMTGISAGIWELDPNTGELFTSDRLLEILGRRRSGPGERGTVAAGGFDLLLSRIHPDDREAVQTGLQRSWAERLPFEMRYRFRHADGHYLTLFVRGHAEWDETGRAVRMAGSAEDVSDYVKSQEAEQRIRARLDAATYLGGVGTWEYDVATRRLDMDQRTRDIHEIPDDLEPDTEFTLSFFPDAVRPKVRASIDDAVVRHKPWDVELPFVTATGRRAWVRSLGTPIVENGHTVRLVGSFQDITRRKRREDELEKLSERLALALRTSKVGIWEYNPKTGAHWWDEGSSELFGLGTSATGTLTDWEDRIHPDDREMVLKRVGDSVKTRADYSAQYRICLPDGTIRHLRSFGTLRTDLDGEELFSGVNIDVSRDVEMALELDRQRAEAEAANEAKSRFLANISHEIRTPLNGVLGMAQMLGQTDLDAVQGEQLTILQASGQTLLDLIEDVLDLSRIEAGSMSWHAAPFDPAAMARTVAGMVGPTAAAKGVGIALDCAADLPSRVMGDEKRTRQILTNMAGNAAKFTDEGEIRMRVVPVTGGVRFEVRDTGPGIPRDRIEHIFDRFAQADDSSTRRHGGSGLGLAICRELVELAGGRIGVESRPGEGALFWFELPLEAVEPAIPDAATDTPGERGAAPVSGRILVVDDVETNRLVAQALVRGAGHEVALAADGAEALRRLGEERFDAVLMDIQMPGMPGDEAIRRIRSSGAAWAGLPILAVTADVTKGARERLLALGADGYLPKPLAEGRVRAALADVLRTDA